MEHCDALTGVPEDGGGGAAGRHGWAGAGDAASAVRTAGHGRGAAHDNSAPGGRLRPRRAPLDRANPGLKTASRFLSYCHPYTVSQPLQLGLGVWGVRVQGSGKGAHYCHDFPCSMQW